MHERLRIIGATVQTASGSVELRQGDPIPADMLDSERRRLPFAFEVIPDQAALDCFTSQPHYFDHVAPLAHRLGLTVQVGAGFLSPAEDKSLGLVEPFAEPPSGLRVEPFAEAPTKPARRHDAALVMGPGDIRTAVRYGWKRIAYLCHGIGQDYNRMLAAAAPGENIPWDAVDVVLLPSEYAAERFKPLCPDAELLVVGQPKMDALREIQTGYASRIAALSFRWNHQRAPEASGAMEHYAEGLAEVREYLQGHGITLIGHGHPRVLTNLIPVYRVAGMSVFSSFTEIVEHAAVYACDNSSTLFEFAALDRPVVVMNAPYYRRNVNHGGRFWDWADVGEQVDGPDELGPAILRAIEDDQTYARRREVVSEVLPLTDGKASERAAEALRERFPAADRMAA